MNRPYLTTELDTQYQLRATRDGCLPLWGKVIYRGQAQGYALIFRKHGYYAIQSGDGGEAIEITIVLSRQYKPLMQTIATGYLHTWLNTLPTPHSDLLQHEHDFLEYWKIKNNRLSVILVWYRQAPDWSIIPNCVQRLIKVTEVIKSVDG